MNLEVHELPELVKQLMQLGHVGIVLMVIQDDLNIVRV